MRCVATTMMVIGVLFLFFTVKGSAQTLQSDEDAARLEEMLSRATEGFEEDYGPQPAEERTLEDVPKQAFQPWGASNESSEDTFEEAMRPPSLADNSWVVYGSAFVVACVLRQLLLPLVSDT